MDYKEEQRSEVEALEAIYPSEYTLLSEDPITFTIVTKTTEFEDTGEGYTALLKFKFTPKYPEEIPEIEIVPAEEDDEQTNLEPEEAEELVNALNENASENTGMAMVFTLVSVAIEWLNERWDRLVKEKEDDEERKRLQEEEEEQKRFDGTRVTIQTFIEWKTKFDAEMAAKKKEVEAKEKEALNKKLTGKELFMRDKTLNDSDLTFDEGDDAVPIDESLFEDLDDLDIEDEEDPELAE